MRREAEEGSGGMVVKDQEGNEGKGTHPFYRVPVQTRAEPNQPTIKQILPNTL